MKPELILQSDLLDLLFEGRNKSYGAYALRKGYVRRLATALGTMLLLVAMLLFIQRQWKNGGSRRSNGSFIIPGDTEIKQVEVIPPAKAQPRQPEPKATISNPKPVIVKDDMADKPMHTVDELGDDVKIGLKDLEGPKSDLVEPPVEIVQAPAAQATAAPVEKAPEILYRADVMPEFPGGRAALMRFLQRHLRVPDAMTAGGRVEVRARFVVNEQGDITGIAIVTSGGEIFDQEVRRVLKKMPAWKPGRQAGRAVPVYFTLPVVFQTYEE